MDVNRYRNRFAYLAVLGGFIVHLSLGGIYTHGSMYQYIFQYMTRNTINGTMSSKTDVSYIFSLAIFGRGASMTLGGFLEHKLGAKVTILLGGAIMSIGYLLTFLSIRVHIIVVAITYGLIVGIGTGLAYGVAMTIPSEWFPKSRGLLAGIVLSGFGVGSLGFDLIQALYINKDVSNTSLVNPDNVPLSFIVMGCVYFVMQVIGAPLIKKAPVRLAETVSVSEFDILGYPKVDNFKPHQLIFIPEFWIIWMSYTLNSVTSVLFILLQKTWGKTLNFSDLKVIISTSVGGIFSIFGRIIWGFLVDKYGYKIIMKILTLSTAIMLGTFYLCLNVGNLNNKYDNGRYAMYFVWVVILFFLTSGNFSLFPAICVKAFGEEHYTGNFGVLFTGYSFSGLVTSVIITNQFSSSDISSFLYIFLAGSGTSLISFIVSLLYRNPSGKIFISSFF